MANTTVTIASDGSVSPETFHANPGDIVSFVADGADTVLCISPDILFGAERYEIPNGNTLDLEVQAEANNINFSYSVFVGDLTAECSGSRGTGPPGGTTGPP